MFAMPHGHMLGAFVAVLALLFMLYSSGSKTFHIILQGGPVRHIFSTRATRRVNICCDEQSLTETNIIQQQVEQATVTSLAVPRYPPRLPLEPFAVHRGPYLWEPLLYS